MDIILLFLFCLLASMGLVQALGWAICRWMRPQKRPGVYTVAPLSSQPALLESQLRYYLLRRSWGGLDGPLLLVPQRELDEEARQMCKRMLEGVIGVFLCYPWELESTLHSFERIREEKENPDGEIEGRGL